MRYVLFISILINILLISCSDSEQISSVQTPKFVETSVPIDSAITQPDGYTGRLGGVEDVEITIKLLRSRN